MFLILLYIIPTYECNLNCNSCYSQKYKETYAECLSWERFIGIYNKFSPDRVAFIGGEAIKWKFINEAILFLENKKVKISLFSNGIDIPKAMPDCVIINANNLLNNSYSDKIKKNIRLYRANKVRVTLRFNVDENFENKIISSVDLAKQYADMISLSVLFPVEYGNKLIGTNLYMLAKELIKNKISAHVSRATPLCLFSEKQQVFLEKNCKMRGVCSLPTNSLVVNPDGISTQPCVELDIVKNIDSFSTKSIKESFESEIDRLKNRSSNECSECNFYKEKMCFGGCLAYK